MKMRYMLAGILSIVFCAAAVSAEPLTFAVIGNTGKCFLSETAGQSFLRTAEELMFIRPDIIVHTGDGIAGCGEDEVSVRQEYRCLSSVFSSIKTPVCFVAGDKDYATPIISNNFHDFTGMKEDSYAFKYKGYGFVVINTDTPGLSGKFFDSQRYWLERTLRSRKNKSSGLFVFMHRPIFSKNNREAGRGALLEMAARNKVTAVFSAHENNFFEEKFQASKLINLGSSGDKYPYLLVNAENGKISYSVLEPCSFTVLSATGSAEGKPFGEAYVFNVSSRAAGTISLKGIELTLPSGEYAVKTEPVVLYGRLEPWERASSMVFGSLPLSLPRPANNYDVKIASVAVYAADPSISCYRIQYNCISSGPVKITLTPAVPAQNDVIKEEMRSEQENQNKGGSQ